MPFRLFQPTYKSKETGETRRSGTYNIAFRDHLNRRQTLAGDDNEDKARRIAERVMELVSTRREGSSPEGKLQRWLDALPPKMRERLVAMDLIDVQAATSDVPLLVY